MIITMCMACGRSTRNRRPKPHDKREIRAKSPECSELLQCSAYLSMKRQNNFYQAPMGSITAVTCGVVSSLLAIWLLLFSSFAHAFFSSCFGPSFLRFFEAVFVWLGLMPSRGDESLGQLCELASAIAHDTPWQTTEAPKQYYSMEWPGRVLVMSLHFPFGQSIVRLSLRYCKVSPVPPTLLFFRRSNEATLHTRVEP